MVWQHLMSVVFGYLDPRGATGVVCRHWHKIFSEGRAQGFKTGPEEAFHVPPTHPRRAAADGNVQPLAAVLARCREQEQQRWAYYGYLERPMLEDGRLGSHAQVNPSFLSLSTRRGFEP